MQCRNYTVQPGDSLWNIATKYQVSIAELIILNPQIADQVIIYPNQVITIPPQPGSEFDPEAGGSCQPDPGIDQGWQPGDCTGACTGQGLKPGHTAMPDTGYGAMPRNTAAPDTGYGAMPRNTAKPDAGQGWMPEYGANPDAGFVPQPEPNSGEGADFSFPQESQVIALVNDERARMGLRPLTPNRELAKVARTKSEDMYKNNYFGHRSPTYGSAFDMLNSFGIRFSAAAENIAQGQATAQSVMSSWMSSPGHRANILNDIFTEIGVGYVDEGGTPYWTQMFIRP